MVIFESLFLNTSSPSGIKTSKQSGPACPAISPAEQQSFSVEMANILSRINPQQININLTGNPATDLRRLPSIRRIISVLDRILACPSHNTHDYSTFTIGFIAMIFIYSARGNLFTRMGRSQEAASNYTIARQYYEAILNASSGGDKFANFVATNNRQINYSLRLMGYTRQMLVNWYQQLP